VSSGRLVRWSGMASVLGGIFLAAFVLEHPIRLTE
jgi:hypothetical protein